MKKQGKRRFITAVITGVVAVAAFVCGMTLSACSNSKIETKILEVPQNLRIKDEYLIWDEVPEAESYIVEINDEEYTTQTNSLDIFELTNEIGKYKLKACGVGNHETTYDSDWSKEINRSVYAPRNLEYKLLEDGTYEVSAKNEGEARQLITGKLIIPSEYNGKRVTAIGEDGFRQCQNLAGVYIPDCVLTIGNNAFAKCSYMSRVKLSNNLNAIGKSVFDGCGELKEIAIPESVEEIKSRAFMNCGKLENIYLPEGLRNIDSYSLQNCSALKSLILPSTLNEVLGMLTYGCDSLDKLEIRNGGNEIYKSESNCIIEKENNSLVLGCAASIIPDYVCAIGDNALRGCALSEIKIPELVKEIGNNAFTACKKLQNITIPEGVISIGMNTFASCDSLENVSLPSTLQSLPDKHTVFQFCGSIKSIVIDENNPVYKSDGNCIIRKSDNVLVMGCAASVIPVYVTVIGDCSFIGCFGVNGDVITKNEKGKSLVIPNGVKEIGRSAFANCNLLQSVHLPDSVIKIGGRAFNKCYYTSIVIPSSVQYIGGAAFEYAVVYTAYKLGESPEGWVKDWNTGCFGNYGCELRYDEKGYPFVASVSKGNGSMIDDVSVGRKKKTARLRMQ